MKRSPMPRRRKPMKRTPIRRTGHLARSGPPKPRKRLPARSKATAARDRQYSWLRRVWLPGRPCVFPGCQHRATDVHHRRGRGATFVLNVATWSPLCRAHHQLVTDHPDLGRSLGLVESRHLTRIPLMATVHRSTARCRSCAAPIAWATTVAGQSIPLQATPAGRPLPVEDTGKSGRIQRVEVDELDRNLMGEIAEHLVDRLVVRALGKGEDADPDRPVWLSHFVDCPNADYHRQAGTGRGRL